jgi:LysM repeat protein
LGGAFVALSVTPLLAQASTFSFIESLLGATAQASGTNAPSLNSQTIPLLAGALNLDPSPAVGGGDIAVADGALVPEEGPAGTAADVAERPASSQISVYVVHPGDTLGEIAAMFGVSVNTIVWANDIQGGVITPGQTLVILPVTGVQHTVQKGESLASLASAYKSDAHEIALFNDLADNTALTPGQTIIIPDGEMNGASSGAGVSSGGSSNSSGGSVMTKVRRLAKTNQPTAPLRGVSSLDEGNYYAWPVHSCVITQGLHGFNGVDLGAPKGTPIYAAAGGLVIVARQGGWNGGYGSYVVIAHGNGTQTLYAHMSKVIAQAGEEVTQGDEVGLVGMTGEATGPHLHFEVRGAMNPFGEYPVGTSCE